LYLTNHACHIMPITLYLTNCTSYTIPMTLYNSNHTCRTISAAPYLSGQFFSLCLSPILTGHICCPCFSVLSVTLHLRVQFPDRVLQQPRLWTYFNTHWRYSTMTAIMI